MSFNPHGPLMTRFGRKAELLAVLSPKRALSSGQTVVVIVTDVDGSRTIEAYHGDGCYFDDRRRSLMDLVNAPVSVVAERIRSVVTSDCQKERV